jgi:ribosomal protein L37AE/L43A
MNYKIKCKHCEKTQTTKEKLIWWTCSSCTMNYKIKCKHCEKTQTTKEKLIWWTCSSCTMKYTLGLPPLDK